MKRTFDIARLRSVIRMHPELSKYLTDGSEVSKMKKSELLALADQLGIQMGSVNAAGADPKTRDCDDLDCELRLYSLRSPAFDGVIEFDLELRLFGRTVSRKARVEYTYTPQWPYFDVGKKQVMTGWPSSTIGFEILAVFEGVDGDVKNEKAVGREIVPRWTRFDVCEEGVLPETVWGDIDRLIDDRAQAEDAKRRQAAFAYRQISGT